MTTPIALMSIGIVLIIASFFVPSKEANGSERVEHISMSMHQEMSQLNARMKRVEEELLIPSHLPKANPSIQKPSEPKKAETPKVHAIVENQMIALHEQGYDINEIAKRSSLPPAVVIDVLRKKGVHVS